MGASAGKLAGKAALVTGGSRSLGAAITKRLAADGAAVVVNYSSSKERKLQTPLLADFEPKGAVARRYGM